MSLEIQISLCRNNTFEDQFICRLSVIICSVIHIAITYLNGIFHFTGPYECISQEPTYQEHPRKKPGFFESLKSTIFSKLGINRQYFSQLPSQDLSYYQVVLV